MRRRECEEKRNEKKRNEKKRMWGEAGWIHSSPGSDQSLANSWRSLEQIIIWKPNNFSLEIQLNRNKGASTLLCICQQTNQLQPAFYKFGQFKKSEKITNFKKQSFRSTSIFARQMDCSSNWSSDDRGTRPRPEAEHLSNSLWAKLGERLTLDWFKKDLPLSLSFEYFEFSSQKQLRPAMRKIE